MSWEKNNSLTFPLWKTSHLKSSDKDFWWNDFQASMLIQRPFKTIFKPLPNHSTSGCMVSRLSSLHEEKEKLKIKDMMPLYHSLTLGFHSTIGQRESLFPSSSTPVSLLTKSKPLRSPKSFLVLRKLPLSHFNNFFYTLSHFNCIFHKEVI